MIRHCCAASIRNATHTTSTSTTTTCLKAVVSSRAYAKGSSGLDDDGHASKELIAEAMKDYLRKTNFPHLNTKKTPHEFKKDNALANQYSFQMLLRKSKVKQQLKQKAALKQKALNALPMELRREAVKIDYSAWPALLQPVDYMLPPQEGFRLPDEPAKNEL